MRLPTWHQLGVRNIGTAFWGHIFGLRIFMKTLFKFIGRVIKRTSEDHVSAFAAESSLFIIMGLVPFILIVFMIIRITPLTEADFVGVINHLVPEAFSGALTALVHQIFEGATVPMFIVASVSILWTLGKSFVSIIEGLNSVFHIEEKRNGLVVRLVAIGYALIFIVLFILVIAIYVLGNQINDFSKEHIPFLAVIFEGLLRFRIVIVMAILTIAFTVLYVAVPRRKAKIRFHLPGAIFTAIGWSGFSFFFSLYLSYAKYWATLYGSLFTIAFAMLWLYVCMYIFLIGAEINSEIESWAENKPKGALMKKFVSLFTVKNKDGKKANEKIQEK